MVSPLSPRRRALAEAAAWIARLNAGDRHEGTEAGLRQWLQADPGNQQAFERATEIWGLIPGAASASPAGRERPLPARPANAPFRLRAPAWGLALAASLLLLLGIGGGWWLIHRPVALETDRGQQEMATLEDGSRITLNTDTMLSVRYDEDVREIRLEQGEAMFEVASNRLRPFIVRAGSKSVRALGTTFIVRRTGDQVSVVLIEGKVAVDEAEAPSALPPARPVVLDPGERLSFAEAGPAIDRPSIEAVAAWRRGQAMFDDTLLSAAAAELNRYGGPRLLIPDPRVGSLKVSGVFGTNDTDEFARAVATLHGLKVERIDGTLRLSR